MNNTKHVEKDGDWYYDDNDDHDDNCDNPICVTSIITLYCILPLGPSMNYVISKSTNIETNVQKKRENLEREKI